jgi:hypothetical protein
VVRVLLGGEPAAAGLGARQLGREARRLDGEQRLDRSEIFGRKGAIWFAVEHSRTKHGS